KMVKGADTRPVSLDIALFGRMVTSTAFANVEASMQVAHAFSTNKVLMETDFFTAMDDMIDGNDELGSGMMGEVDYNSSCYYIYASLDTEKLRDNLRHSEHPEEIVKAAVPSLLRTMAFTNPGGKQNTFAGHALPSAVLVECKDDPIPVSYANAFVEPARAKGDKDLVMDSIGKLAEQVKTTTRDFPSLGARKRVWFCTGEKVKLEVDGSVSVPNFDALVQEVLAVAEK
ncbi:MAG: type I-E CRISPR-associated protein Cas7/Cse4/CasC, partial [Selenomonadaceae bacterium]|nr:type I-E CRISPR-associated protein Cas7/Cse4/CasC [Selenomonadaceae bacterium]